VAYGGAAKRRENRLVYPTSARGTGSRGARGNYRLVNRAPLHPGKPPIGERAAFDVSNETAIASRAALLAGKFDQLHVTIRPLVGNLLKKLSTHTR